VILAYDQLLFRPLVAWADKFRFEQTASGNAPTNPGCSTCCAAPGAAGAAAAVRRGANASFTPAPARAPRRSTARDPAPPPSRVDRCVWLASWSIAGARVCALARRGTIVGGTSLERLVKSGARLGYGLITLLRVVVLIALATLIWVPIGVWIGLRPKLAERIQPLAQFLAAFPANLLFPVVVV
jgi:NitT/TauT family transport system permease protein